MANSNLVTQVSIVGGLLGIMVAMGSILYSYGSFNTKLDETVKDIHTIAVLSTTTKEKVIANSSDIKLLKLKLITIKERLSRLEKTIEDVEDEVRSGK